MPPRRYEWIRVATESSAVSYYATDETAKPYDLMIRKLPNGKRRLCVYHNDKKIRVAYKDCNSDEEAIEAAEDWWPR